MSDVNADKIPVPAQPEVLLHCLMDIAEALLAVGAEVNRVEDTLTRMGTAYGAVRMNAFVITSSIVVTMTLPSGPSPRPAGSCLPAARISPFWKR